MSIENRKGYSIILEPSIYHELNWDMDLIVSCLNIVRGKLKHLCDLPERTTCDLIALSNFLGQSYPAIGLNLINNVDIVLDSQYLSNKVDEMIKGLGLTTSKKKQFQGD